MNIPSFEPSAAETPICYRHLDRPAYVRCTRCDRHICPDCMCSADVGHQCVDCFHADAPVIRQSPAPLGGQPGTPVLSYLLIAINVGVFLLELTSLGLERRLALWPPAVADGQLYRLASSAFLHYSMTHLLFNMWALFVVGPPLERWLGRLRFGALYAVSALGGSVLVYLLSPLNVVTAGASGAIFGLFGATFVVAKWLALDVRAVVMVIVINLIFTFGFPVISGQHISWQAHVGGLVSGALIAAICVCPVGKHRNRIQAIATLVVLAVFAALIHWRTSDLLAQFGAYLGMG
ncbi:MAG: rhomboid family intramembrane serine protease [Mycobacteriaceae bacterium]|nr:rhomboid family intramembrane serine protease [Mycobacteriaceae bacterium]